MMIFYYWWEEKRSTDEQQYALQLTCEWNISNDEWRNNQKKL